MTADIIEARRAHTRQVLDEVREAFLDAVGEARATALGEHTTVYVTGSCGRGDMGPASDLDPYVVRVDGSVNDADRDVLATALADAVKKVGLPDLDNNGEYARLVQAESLFNQLGSPQDDQQNALTRRMLLLLESRPLVNKGAYDLLLASTINEYWKNEREHPTDYLPIVLVNDIVRYWRIVLLNHESRLREKSKKTAMSPVDEMALRRYSSYKLRVPRCLSCFSALAYLLALTPSEPAHVGREDVLQMVRMTPWERLVHLRSRPGTPTTTVDTLMEEYAMFLKRTDGGRTDLTDKLARDPAEIEAVSRGGREFTKHMFDLIQLLGGGRTLHRAIVV